jgi:hypothetical protein
MSGAAGLATLASSAMVSISEELKAAKAAKAAIDTLSASAPDRKLLPTLRNAHRIAVIHLSSEGPLNEARGKAGIALSNLMHWPPTPEKIEKAKGAVEEWINQLRT